MAASISSRQYKSEDSECLDLLVSPVVALYQDGRLNLSQLLSRLQLLLVLVSSIETLNDLGRLVQTTLFLIYTPAQQASK